MNQIITDLTNWYLQINVDSMMHIVIAIGMIIAASVLSPLIAFIVLKLFYMKEKDIKKIKGNSFYKPLKWLVTCTGVYIAILVLKLPDSVVALATKLFKIITILLIANGFARIFKPGSYLFEKLKENEKLKGNDHILKFLSKVVSVIAYTLALFMIIAELGYDLNGVIAGLGLGSVVVALAVQDIAKSMFAGMIIFLDKPFAIGDYVQFQNQEGTVEDMSFRSTRIRLLNNSVLTVPNQVLTTESITNWNRIEKRRYATELYLPLQTSMQTIENLTKQMKDFLEKMPQVIPNSVEVHFTEILQDSMQISIYVYTKVTAYNEYLSWKQEINLLLMQILEENEVKLAYRTQEVHVKNI